MGNRWLAWRMRWMAAGDRRRLSRLRRDHPGFEVDPEACSALGTGTFHLYEGARVRFGSGVVTERRFDGLRVSVREDAELDIGENVWLRSDLAPVLLYVYPGARLEIGPDSFLNGCMVSAKVGVTLGRGVWLGPGTRVFDADQHDLDDATPERRDPVEIGDHAWVAADVAVMRGVSIGAHSVIGSRSVVTSDIPPHSLAFGSPARVRGTVGDRSQVPI
ncbi:MAG: acyltransferase [Myxococcota bacterium]|nr:acyltransferase [Myxococcota bacterium]